jgi:hypothetical protein
MYLSECNRFISANVQAQSPDRVYFYLGVTRNEILHLLLLSPRYNCIVYDRDFNVLLTIFACLGCKSKYLYKRE